MNLRSLCALGAWYVLSIGVASLACAQATAQHANNPAATARPTSTGAIPSIDRRRYPAYSVFAAQVPLPTIAVLEQRVLRVDGGRLDFSATASPPVSGGLAKRFGIPLNALKTVVHKLAADDALRGPQLAEALRTVVIDYKFLEAQWSRWHPAGPVLQIKKEGIDALTAGDLDRAWTLFESLPRPQPPASLQISGH